VCLWRLCCFIICVSVHKNFIKEKTLIKEKPPYQRKLPLMKKLNTVILLSAVAVGSATAQQFTGAGADQNFSTVGNWDSGVPTAGATISIAANGTSLIAPAVVDASFGVVGLASAKIYSEGAGGTGMSYVDVTSGGTLRGSNINVGNVNNQFFDGTLTVRTGGGTQTAATNGGTFSIGGNDAGEVGVLLIEDGATMQHSKILLDAFGTMTFEFGASSVSTFNTVKNNAGASNILNGLLQVDLGALVGIGSYTLIDSSNADLLIAGLLATDLGTAGGTITSSDTSTHFNVLNEGAVVWSLTTANAGQDLVFNVSAIPEPGTYAMLAGCCALTFVMLRRRG
jgi:hypothetical protein